MIKLSAEEFTVSVDSKRNFYNIELKKEPVQLECEMAYDQEMEKLCEEVDDNIIFIEGIFSDMEDALIFDDKLREYYLQQEEAIITYVKEILRCKNYLQKRLTRSECERFK